MTKSNDGKWEPPTDSDSAQIDDQPTVAATAEQIEQGRVASIRPDSTPTPARRTTAQGLAAVQLRAPAASEDNMVTGDFSGRDEPDDLDPASTARGLPVVDPRPPAASGSGSMKRSGPTLSGLDGKGVRPPNTNGSGSISASKIAETATVTDDFEPRNTARGIAAQTRPPGDELVLLDRVVSTPVEDVAQRTAGSFVVVATGTDGERVRRLCHMHSLLLPVMSTISIAPGSLSIVLGEPSPPAPDRVIHVVRPTISDAQIVDLLRALVSGHVLVERAPQPTAPDPRAKEFALRIARMQDRAAIENTMIEALTILLDADRAYCRFFDPVSGALWSEGHRRTLGDNSRATSGLVGFAAYTGQTIHASPPGEDPRWVQELDDPDGKPQSRMIVQPIIGGDRRVHCVLVAVRRWRNAAFGDAELHAIAELAALCAPALDLIASSGPRAAKFRPSNTIPGPLASAARESAVVDARAKRPSSRPPPLTTRPPTNPPLESKPITGGSPVVAASAGDSRPLRASTVQPPSTSTTGRTRALSQSGPVQARTPSTDFGPSQSAQFASIGERPSRPSQAALRSRPFHQVALVANDTDHDRVHRVAKTCGLDVAIVTATELAPPDARVITLGQPWSPAMDPRVVYVARDAISNDALADLITAVSSGRVLGAPAQLTKPTNPNEARRAQQAFTGSRTFASAASLAAAETSAVSTLRELLDADRAYFLYYDDEDGSLRSALRARDDRSAIAGMAGWVARTGRAASAERGTADPRWLGPIDDPDGDPNSQLMIEPVISGDRVRAVLVAARRPRRPGFVDADREMIARFAALVAPLVEQLTLHADQSAPPPAPPQPAARSKRATEQALDDLREAQPIWQKLPKWAYAAGGVGVLALIALIARC